MRDERDGACHLLSSDTDIITAEGTRRNSYAANWKLNTKRLLLLCWEGLKVFCLFERLSRGVSEEIWDLFVEVKIVWRNLINIDANAFRILFLETSSFYRYLIALWFSRIANFLQQSIFCDKSESSRFHKFLLQLFYYTSNWILKLNTEDVWYWKQTG